MQKLIENMGKNLSSFKKGYEILEKNGAFLIFPEGVSIGKRVLEKLKTGAERIGLESEFKNDFNLNIVIIPIGLSYSDQVRFRSNIMIRFGDPIKLDNFEKDYKTNQVETVKKVTTIIEQSLNNLTNYYQTNQIEDIVQGLELIYKMELMVELGMEVDNKNDDFIASKILTDAVQWYEDNEPDLIIQFRKKLNKYIELLKHLDIRDEFLDPVRQEKGKWGKTKTILFLIIGSPLFIWGIITNYIPYILPRVLVKINNKDQSEEASWKLIYGFFFFVFYYAASITLFWKLTQNLFLTSLFISSLIPSGDFALYYLSLIHI